MDTKPSHPVRLTEAEAAQFTHESYLIQIREQSCTHCGSGERWSEIFEVWTHPVQTRRTSAINLRPSLTLRKGMLVGYTTIPAVQVPVCSDCIATFNPEEGAALVPAVSRAAWQDTLMRKYAPEPKPQAKLNVPTLDQL